MNCFTFRKLTTVFEKIGSRPFEFGRIITFTRKARHNACLLVILRLEFFLLAHVLCHQPVCTSGRSNH